MDCPRCGGSLTQYQLADAETVACDDCIYVGVSVDHTSEKGQRESWTEALDRFYQEHSAEQVEEVLAHEEVPLSEDVLPVFESAEEQASATDDDAEATTDDDADSAADSESTDSADDNGDDESADTADDSESDETTDGDAADDAAQQAETKN